MRKAKRPSRFFRSGQGWKAGQGWGRKSDIPLSRDDSGRFLPWIIALMVYLAALTLAGALTLRHSLLASYRMENESFSVHIPADGNDRETRAQAALKLLRGLNGVEEANAESAEHLREMVRPWLGQGDIVATLPLPIVITVRLAAGYQLDEAFILRNLRQIAPAPHSSAGLSAGPSDRASDQLSGIEIDDHQLWLEAFTRLLHRIQNLMLFVVLLTFAASAAIVTFACRTSLKLHQASVQLLHRLGAVDSYIVRQFQSHAGLIALKGAFIGSGCAAGSFLSLQALASRLQGGLTPSFALTWMHGLVFLGLPFLMALLARATARLSVLSSLGEMP
jgi:cell division transport system permease protein